MITMDQSLEDLVNRGVVERAIARSLAVDQAKFS